MQVQKAIRDQDALPEFQLDLCHAGIGSLGLRTMPENPNLEYTWRLDRRLCVHRFPYNCGY